MGDLWEWPVGFRVSSRNYYLGGGGARMYIGRQPVGDKFK